MSITGLNKGVKFGNKNSLTDWGIYLKNRPSISPPEPKTSYIEIAGRDGDIDATESLTGYVNYHDRTIEMEFTIIDPREFWSEKYSEIMDYMHGKSMRIIMDEAPDYYYEGRITVGTWDSERKKSTLPISAKVYPFKRAVQSTLSDWLWNPFNFESGVIRSNYRNLSVSEDENTTLTVTASRMPTSPKYVVALTDSNPTVEWSQGTITGGSNASSDAAIRTGMCDGLCVIRVTNSALKYAVAVYNDSGTYQGWLNSAGNAQTNIVYYTGQKITPPTQKFRIVAFRQDGEDILPSAGSAITARICMTVKASNNSTTYPLLSGTNTVEEIIVRESDVTLTFRGNGTVSVDYQQGRF